MSLSPIEILEAIYNPGAPVARAAGDAIARSIATRDAQDRAYAEMKRRYANLQAWGAATKAPETLPILTEWQTFAPAWESGTRDGEALRVQALHLATAEGNAQLRGYSSPDVPALSAAQRAPTGAPMTPGVVDTQPPPDKPSPPDPYVVPKAIGVGALGLGTVAATVSARSDAARAGIAVVGLALTGIAGWFAFKPAEAKKEEKKP